MQVGGELGNKPSSIQAGADAQPIPNEALRTRKITVQLSQSIFQRLEAATDRPGVGKSMVVETALERFLDPAPPIEGLIHEALDRIGGQMSRLEREIAIIAETVALHARYHLTLTPPMSPSQQRDACMLGRERFKALAEQVDRRVRLGRPVMRETLEGRDQPAGSELGPKGEAILGITHEQVNQEDQSVTLVDEQTELSAAAGEGGSNLNFRHLPNAFC
ncbi:hypothetical protein [Bradyrhizobium sp. ARR65]|uniref:hypothetical protein n=1 Tax=Bradyrhizobium sp. ARR65 TaxID=1040989 RepID=UPI000466238F|nr:hypothetical protein [Bradyrhizobium sp. ARR65]